MDEAGPNMQDFIRLRQQEDFVGRTEWLTEFGANLRRPLDRSRTVLFSVHGVAGVGKTYLTDQFRRIAKDGGLASARADQSSYDVVETMGALAADLAGQGRALSAFDKRHTRYRERRRELEKDSGAPGGALLTRSVVRLGQTAARGVPGLSLATDAVDAEQVDQVRAYLRKKFRSAEDVRLLLSPVDVLTRLFLADLGKVAARQQVALFFDTFELTAPFLDGWLFDVITGRHGPVPANVVVTVAGQRPLDAARWSSLRGVVTEIALDPFTEAEARALLSANGVHDETLVRTILVMSGRLPLWLATLAERPPTDGVGADPANTALEQFLKWEPDERRRAVALAGALPRRLNEDLLEAAGDSPELFDWLRDLPFVTATAGHWRYHEVARAPMLRLYRSRSPRRWRERHRLLAAHYRAEHEALSLTEPDCWADTAWQEHRVEECYHELCADPTNHLVPALVESLTALAYGTTNARRWAAAMVAAGQDREADQVLLWGQRLADAVADDDADGMPYLTEVIDRGNLPAAARKEAFRLRGRAHREAKRLEQALADFDTALRQDPDFANALAGRAETYLLMERLDDAFSDYDRAVGLEPDGWNLAGRGEVRLTMGRNEEAILDFAAALAVDPTLAWAHAYRGLALVRLGGREEEALRDVTRAIELQPDYVWAISMRASILDFREDHDEALADIDQVIALDENDAWAFAMRGNIRRARGQHAEALSDLDRAVELGAEEGWAFVGRGRIHAAAGRHDDAAKDYEQALRLDSGVRDVDQNYLDLAHHNRSVDLAPGLASVRLARARTYLALGAFESAVADADRAVELEPDNPYTAVARGKIWLRVGHADKAIAEFSRAVELQPKTSWNHYYLGLALRTTGRRADADAGFRVALDLTAAEVAEQPGRSLHRFNIAVYRAALDRWDDASTQLRETLALRPPSSDLAALLEDLDDLGRLPDIDPERLAALRDLVVAWEAQVDPSV